jgi:serine protease Do
VRAVQGWGADLSLFQFHGQLTWAVFFLNPDRTIYGRYGSRAPSGTTGFKGNDRFVTMEGFKKAVQGALELHAAYPANKASLAGKTGPPPAVKSPELFPAAASYGVRRADGSDPKNKGCVHCHEVQDWEAIELRKKGPVGDRYLWTYPMPDALGLALDPVERATATAVAPGSAAEKGGFKAGDRLLTLEGQPLLSIADVQWVLHQAPEPGVVKGDVDRGGKKVAVTLELKAGWRRSFSFADNLSVGWTTRTRTAGMRLETLPENDRDNLGLAAGVPALRVKDLSPDFARERNVSPKKAGLLKGDVLLELDGHPIPATESEYLALLLQKKKPGDKAILTYRRGAAPAATVEIEVR